MFQKKRISSEQLNKPYKRPNLTLDTDLRLREEMKEKECEMQSARCLTESDVLKKKSSTSTQESNDEIYYLCIFKVKGSKGEYEKGYVILKPGSVVKLYDFLYEKDNYVGESKFKDKKVLKKDDVILIDGFQVQITRQSYPSEIRNILKDPEGEKGEMNDFPKQYYRCSYSNSKGIEKQGFITLKPEKYVKLYDLENGEKVTENPIEGKVYFRTGLSIPFSNYNAYVYGRVEFKEILLLKFENEKQKNPKSCLRELKLYQELVKSQNQNKKSVIVPQNSFIGKYQFKKIPDKLNDIDIEHRFVRSLLDDLLAIPVLDDPQCFCSCLKCTIKTNFSKVKKEPSMILLIDQFYRNTDQSVMIVCEDLKSVKSLKKTLIGAFQSCFKIQSIENYYDWISSERENEKIDVMIIDRKTAKKFAFGIRTRLSSIKFGLLIYDEGSNIWNNEPDWEKVEIFQDFKIDRRIIFTKDKSYSIP